MGKGILVDCGITAVLVSCFVVVVFLLIGVIEAQATDNNNNNTDSKTGFVLTTR